VALYILNIQQNVMFVAYILLVAFLTHTTSLKREAKLSPKVR
jgi:hypothetical protein